MIAIKTSVEIRVMIYVSEVFGIYLYITYQVINNVVITNVDWRLIS